MAFASRFQIVLAEERRIEKLCQAYAESLTQFVKNPQDNGIIGAIDQISDGRFRDAAALIQRILCHVLLGKKFLQPLADRLIQVHFS